MKIWQKILVIILIVMVIAGTIFPIFANAAPETSNTTQSETVDGTTENDNPDTIIEDEIGNNASVTVKMKLTNIDEKVDTDNVIIYFINEDTRQKTKVLFQKNTDFSSVVHLSAGTYKVNFSSADNKRELALKGNKITVPEAKEVSVDIEVSKVLNNNFFPKFFRNNSLLLILLAVSGIAYYVLKKRREAGLTTH